VLGLPLALVLVLLLFPDGRVPSPRWRPVVWITLAVGVVRTALFLLGPGPVRLESHELTVPWDGALALSRTTVERLDGTTGALSIVLLLAAVASLAVRFVRGDDDTRRRLTPLALAAATIVAGVLLQTISSFAPAGVVVFVIGGALVPVALVVGALRYRVWDLDPLLVRSIVYAGLAVLVTVLYVAVVQGIVLALGQQLESDGLLPAVAATVVVAVVFAPAKERIERAARRLVYGERATPYETLTALPQRLVDAPALDEVLPATAQSIARGLGVAAAGVAVDVAGRDQQIAWWPEPPETNPGTNAGTIPVRHLGDHVGDLFVVPHPDRPLTRDDRRLLADLAAQAGAALKAVSLSAELAARLEQITAQSEELAASRERIVRAQSDERRRLQRDLHDGVQQRLVATAMRLGAARALVATDPERVLEELAAADRELGLSLDEIREVSRGLHPSTLAARGLVASLQIRAEVSRQPVEVRETGVADVRLAPEVEAAAYYSCLEALQNAAKHAPGAAVVVDLGLRDGVLAWSVSDDGPGFDATALNGSGGLAGIRDRLAALGGGLTVESGSDGTVVRGRVPAR
jgi:signal transduction histidine kinase